MAVHFCPFCELRFTYWTELEWHVAEDHHREWSASSRNTRGRGTKAGSPVARSTR